MRDVGKKKHGVKIEPDLTRCTKVVIGKLNPARDAALTTIRSVIENFKNELAKQEAANTKKENLIAELEFAQSVMKNNGKDYCLTQSNHVDVFENGPTVRHDITLQDVANVARPLVTQNTKGRIASKLS